jgi:hypothetical protein
MNEVSNPFKQEVQQAQPGASAVALGQREAAEVQGAIMMAKRFPRDPVTAMDRILQDCTRQSLAESALYTYVRGGTEVSGPSIRLAEVLAQRWGNIACGVIELSRSAGYSECVAYAWDLESNFRDEKRFTVRHWRDTKEGGYALKDERDIYELIANMGARRKRACILAVIPGDVQEAAVRQCELTLHTKAQATPERVKAMLERFEEVGVGKAQIEARIGRRIESITPALIVQLGKIYNSIKDGISKPEDWFGAPSKGELPEYPEEQMKKNLPTWRSRVKSGRQKPADIVSMLSTRYRLSEAQISAIMALEKEDTNENPEPEGA